MLDKIAQIEPQSMIFTKTGTYMVQYANSMLAVSTWHWTNESAGELMYSWNNNLEDTNGGSSGDVVTASFQGTRLLLTEKDVEEEYGETFETAMVYTLDEMKWKVSLLYDTYFPIKNRGALLARHHPCFSLYVRHEYCLTSASSYPL